MLVIDDEEVLAELEKDMLEALGYTVAIAHDSATALSLFMEKPGRYSAVLTDQTMPGMTGIELALELMSIRRDIPIVLVTGHSLLVDAESAKAAGVRALVMKPFTKAELARKVRQALAGKEE